VKMRHLRRVVSDSVARAADDIDGRVFQIAVHEIGGTRTDQLGVECRRDDPRCRCHVQSSCNWRVRTRHQERHVHHVMHAMLSRGSNEE
jgi:hypothetical protein